MILSGGAVHLNLWVTGYREIPYIGPLFFLNVLGSIAVGFLVATGTRPLSAVAGIAFSAGSLAALVLSRTVGLFGFMEAWTPPARQTLAAELGAVVLLTVTLVTATLRPLAWIPASSRTGRRPRP
jgi:hypothetical protein